MKAFLYYLYMGIDFKRLLSMTPSEFVDSLPAHNYRGFLQPWMYEMPKHLDLLEVSVEVSKGFWYQTSEEAEADVRREVNEIKQMYALDFRAHRHDKEDQEEREYQIALTYGLLWLGDG